MQPDRERRFVFVVGLHRSGTSLLFRTLRDHPDISGFAGTSAPEDEGQHLQTVIPTGEAFGGPGMFALKPAAAMTESDPRATPETADALFREWAGHWDLDRPILLEKSPPTLIRTRFYQELFPNSSFICVTRHPLAVAYATKKWARKPIRKLLAHWLAAYELFEADQPSLARSMFLKYEDLVADPQGQLDGVSAFLGVPPHPVDQKVRTGINDKYFDAWDEDNLRHPRRYRKAITAYEARTRRFGYSLVDPAWQGPSCLA